MARQNSQTTLQSTGSVSDFPIAKQIAPIKPDRTGSCMNLSLYGITASRGSRNYIIDTSGKKYLDFFSAGAVNLFGYGREDLARTYYEAAKRLQHSMFCYTKNTEAIQLAEELVQLTPGSFEKQVAYGTSGSDSIDGAIKMARRYTGKKCIISFANAFHGLTGFSISTNGFNQLTEGIVDEIEYFKIPFPTSRKKSRSVIEILKYLFDTQKIAGILVEPIQGDGGVVVPEKDFLNKCVRLTQRNKAVFIADEIQSGMGRTGTWWASEHFKIQPDLVVAAKGLSAGFAPISVVVGRSDIVGSLAKAQHIFTYSGHPPSCAVVRKVIQIIQEEQLIKKISIEGKQLMQDLKNINTSTVTDVRGKGFMVGVEAWDSETPIASLIATRCMELGTYFGYYGTKNEVIRIEPPYTITKEECGSAIQHIEQAFTEYQENRLPASTIQFWKEKSRGLGEAV